MRPPSWVCIDGRRKRLNAGEGGREGGREGGKKDARTYHGVGDVVGRDLTAGGQPGLELDGGVEGGLVQVEHARDVALLLLDGHLEGGREGGREGGG